MRTALTQLRFRSLLLLQQLAATGSLHAAAKSMNLTQPALTQALQEIERVFGARLFERTARGVVPTALGHTVVARAQLLLNELARMDDAVAEHQAGRPHVRVGVAPLMMLDVVPQALAFIEAESPSTRVAFREGPVPGLVELLVQGDVELVLGPLPLEWPAAAVDIELEHRTLYEEPLCLLARPDHPLARKRRIEWSDLAKADWVAPARHTLTGMKLATAFVAHGLTPPNPRFESSSVHSNVRLVQRTHCVMAAPRSVGEYYQGLGMVRALKFALPTFATPVSLIVRKHRVDSVGAARFVAAIERAVRDRETSDRTSSKMPG